MNFIKSFLHAPQYTSSNKVLIHSSASKGDNNSQDAPDNENEGFLDSTGATQSTQVDPSDLAPESTTKKEAHYILIDYKVEKHDTLYSIALTYHLDPETLKTDNSLEDDTLTEGQRIKIRVRAKSEACRLKTKIINKDEFLRPSADENDYYYDEYRAKKLKELRMKAERVPQDHWDVYCCTSFGDAEGILMVEGSTLKFNPNITGLQTRSLGSLDDMDAVGLRHIVLEIIEIEKRMKLLEVRIDVQDIAECNMMAVPSLLCEEHFATTREFEKDYLIQVLLYTHGDKNMGKYFEELFNEMKQKKIPYACVYFKLKNMTAAMQEYTNEQKHHMLQEVQAKIMEAKHSKQQGLSPRTATKMPHFEFLYDRCGKKDAELLRKVVKNSLWADSEVKTVLENVRKFSHNSAEEETKNDFLYMPSKGSSQKSKRQIIPRLRQSSNILNLEQFTELVNSVPELYQMLEWDLVYSNMVHGTSYINLLRKAEYASPFIILIQDEDNFVFGVYGNERLHYSQEYYGSGESFLFTFRDLQEISIFTWSKKNKLFLFTSDQGLTFGASPHYGLWINNELSHGRSYPCDTFDNPRLSHHADFVIMRIEVWTIKEPVQ